MIRINLLPTAKKGAAARGPAPPDPSSQKWFVAYAVAAVLWAIGLTLFYYAEASALDEQNQRNAATQVAIDAAKAKSAQLEEVEAQIERSKQLESLVSTLQSARLGPTRVLMEISKILSVGGGPTIDPQRLEQLRRDNPLAGYNRSWDPRRLWLTSFTEERRECKIEGVGKTNEDVAEFLRRLALSDLFTDVTLTKTEASVEAGGGVPRIGFELTCKVRY